MRRGSTTRGLIGEVRESVSKAPVEIGMAIQRLSMLPQTKFFLKNVQYTFRLVVQVLDQIDHQFVPFRKFSTANLGDDLLQYL
jgi:hypothetical protein